MAIMIPSSIDRTDSKRHGEYLVYDWMSNPCIPGVCFYSLTQTTHKHKIMGEVDFLYICEKGILSIEVKGGQDIYREGRNWYSVDKLGRTHDIANPFEQSRGCMEAVRDYLEEVYGKNSAEAHFQLGYCVVFPECVGRCRGGDLVDDVLFDCKKELSDYPRFLSDTLEYWAKEEEKKHFGHRSNSLLTQQVQRMVDLFQADFRSVPSMKLELQSVVEKIHQLSEEQLDAVEGMNINKRVVIQGGAGTGKTLLAIEKARSALAKNKSVLYLCFNHNMAQYAKENLPQDDKINVCSFHSFLTKVLSRDIHDKTIKDVCALFRTDTDVSDYDRYDVLVVDEAQDLMLPEFWDCIDSFIIGGLEKGEWAAFTDPNQSIFNDENNYELGYEYLMELYSPYSMLLNKNWRNTAQIARRTSRLCNVPSAKYMKIDGPRVEKRSFSNKAEFMKIFKEDVRSLITGGVAPSDIMILSQRKLNNSYLADMTEYCGLKLSEMSDLYSLKTKQLNFATVQSYKGLESNVVLYINIEGFKSNESRKLNYVGMSRAKALLYMYVSDDFFDEYNFMMDESV